jgi:hypothetical protein
MDGPWLFFKAQDPRNDYATSAPQYLSIHLGRFGDKRPADPQAHRTQGHPERILDFLNE